MFCAFSMPALARRQGAIQAIGRIYWSCVFNGGDQPIGQLARRWKTIASWRSRCRNWTACKSPLKSWRWRRCIRLNHRSARSGPSPV